MVRGVARARPGGDAAPVSVLCLWLPQALPAQLDGQGWDVQQVGLGEGAAERVEQQGCQGVRAPAAASAYDWLGAGAHLAAPGSSQLTSVGDALEETCRAK
ncbi:hypothetical protein HaLaN_22725 [Haematococcus lacustris]|uniref:Uncharacterized protein n=1 Tax=Haematococcus lacustris TaxID=44745 RepID=A0A6A0A1A3_HAELA|nr:hypothetical protein HaLaN_22725 [Haematococcus lacustris]